EGGYAVGTLPISFVRVPALGEVVWTHTSSPFVVKQVLHGWHGDGSPVITVVFGAVEEGSNNGGAPAGAVDWHIFRAARRMSWPYRLGTFGVLPLGLVLFGAGLCWEIEALVLAALFLAG